MNAHILRVVVVHVSTEVTTVPASHLVFAAQPEDVPPLPTQLVEVCSSQTIPVPQSASLAQALGSQDRYSIGSAAAASAGQSAPLQAGGAIPETTQENPEGQSVSPLQVCAQAAGAAPVTPIDTAANNSRARVMLVMATLGDQHNACQRAQPPNPRQSGPWPGPRPQFSEVTPPDGRPARSCSPAWERYRGRRTPARTPASAGRRCRGRPTGGPPRAGARRTAGCCPPCAGRRA